MKLVKKILGIVLILLVVCLIARNFIIKNGIEQGAKLVTGLKLDIGKLNVGLFKSVIHIEDLKVYNPEGFEDPVMVDIPEVYVDYNLGALLTNKVYAKEVRFHLKEMVVAKNADGKLNLDSLKTVQGSKEEKEKKPAAEEKPKEKMDMKIDLLVLKVDKVTYKDYSKGKPRVTDYNINLNVEEKDITNPHMLVATIMMRTLGPTAIAQLANFDLGGMSNMVGDSFGKISSMGQGAVDDANKLLKGAGDQLKGTGDQLKDAGDQLKGVVDGLKLPFGN